MRRTLAIVASLLALAALGGPAARAHFCATPVEIGVGEPASVTIGVAAEEKPITRVDVGIPAGFELEEVTDSPGWTSEETSSGLTFTGGTIPPFGCSYFTVRGKATKKAALAFPLDLHADDGSVREYRNRELGAQYAAQLVYAGVEPPKEDAAGDSADDSSTGTVIVTAVAAAVGVAGGAWALRYALRKAAPPPRPAAQRRGPPPKKRRKKKR